MGLLERWDQRNQEIADRQRREAKPFQAVDEAPDPGRWLLLWACAEIAVAIVFAIFGELIGAGLLALVAIGMLAFAWLRA